jgi:DNA-binding GntR family transcriptional regulator
MLENVEYRFGKISRLPSAIQWLSEMAHAMFLAIQWPLLKNLDLKSALHWLIAQKATEWQKHLLRLSSEITLLSMIRLTQFTNE